MGFVETIKEFADRVAQMKEKIATEEATKMSMIVPFFQILGYDVFNPSEFCPEYTADVGIKKGEKVDYAIMQEGAPTILIECKWCGEALDKHSSQLFRYFGTSKAKFGILTNGIKYKFYTDLDEANKMDLTPFLEVDLEALKEAHIAELKKFCKETFDKDSIFSTASELKYSNMLKDVIQREIDNPSDEFTKTMISSIYEGTKTQKVVDKFKPIVKKTFTAFLNEFVNQKIATALKPTPEEVVEAPTQPDTESKIVTTEQEIEAFYIVRGILAGVINASKVTYKDTESYFGILFDDNIRKPICRFNLDTKKKQIILPNEDLFAKCCF